MAACDTLHLQMRRSDSPQYEMVESLKLLLRCMACKRRPEYMWGTM